MSEQMIGRLVPPIRDAFPHVVKQHSTRRTKKVAKKATTRRIFKKATARPPNRRRCAMKTQSSISCLSLFASSNYTKTSSIWIVGSGLPTFKTIRQPCDCLLENAASSSFFHEFFGSSCRVLLNHVIKFCVRSFPIFFCFNQ